MLVYSGIQQPTIGAPSQQTVALVAEYAKDNKESTLTVAVKATLAPTPLLEGQVSSLGVVFKPSVDIKDSQTVTKSIATKNVVKHQQHVIEWAQSVITGIQSLQETEVTIPAKGLQANIYVKAWDKLASQSINLVFKDSIPKELDNIITLLSQTVWEYNFIYNDCPVDASNFSVGQIQASQKPKIVDSNNVHDEAGITLYKEQVILCPVTGISYLCKLPTANKMHMVVNHPFSVYANVSQVINGYYKSGVKLEDELTEQVLAGMLLTILREKGLVFGVKDTKQANLFLSQASAPTLSYAVRYFYSLTMVTNKPYLSLNLEHNDEIMSELWKGYHSPNLKLHKEAESYILNYVRVCKGENVKERYILPALQKTKLGSEKVRAKVLIDKVKQQAYIAKDSKTEAKHILALLPKDGNELFISYLGSKIDSLVYMTVADRQKIQQEIATKWLGNALASKLGQCFALSTDAIEDDLLTFTQEQDKEKGLVTKGKVDFMSLLNKGKE